MRKIVVLAMTTVLAGCATMQHPKPRVTLEFRPASQSPGPGLTKMDVPGSESPVYISDDVVLANADVKSARVTMGPNGPRIDIVFTADGAERFARATELLVGKLLAVVVDGKLVAAPRVMEKITGGRAEITGRFSEEEAQRIARGITAK